MTMTDLKHANKGWFSRKNKQFFGDISYRVLQGKATKTFYLVRSTYQWSDMFGGPKVIAWWLNPVTPELKIATLIDQTFPSLESVKEWLKTH